MKIRKEQLADDVTLYCGDSREILPTLSKVDALIVDAPYGIEELVGGYGRAVDKDRTIHNDKNLEVVRDVFALARKQLNRNAWVAAFYSCRITPTFFKMMEVAGYKDHEYFAEVIWDKKAPGMGSQIRYQHENIAFYKIGKPDPLWDAMSVITYIALKGDQKSSHPHEKPDQVMQNIVQAVPGKLVLDPFMGTGSTGAAAVKQKRGFIGVEYDPKYFEVALKKVGVAIKQPTAFWE